MKLQAIPTADYLDIVFDNRNKAYGGYELRKNYSKRTYTAFSLVMGSILILTAYSVLTNPAQAIAAIEKPHGIIDLTPITPPPIVLPKQEIKPPPPAAPKVKTEKFTTPVIVTNDKVKPEDLLVDKTKLDDAVAGNKTSDGTASTTTGITGNGTITKPIFVEPPAPATPFSAVEEMPEFNGNVSSYLGKQLRYPDAARENNVEGKVIVQFIVSEDGSISGAKVLRGIGGGCDEEALRVVRSMPKWKPGKQNGVAVKVYYTLPIRFMLN